MSGTEAQLGDAMNAAGRTIALIPARGGSKGVPGKNVRPLLGIPLIAHSITLAGRISAVEGVYVSTDDETIAKVAEDYGATVIWRPKELAQDHSLVIDAIRHAVESLERDSEPVSTLLLLEATSPIRRIDFVEDCLRSVTGGEFDSAATFCESKVSPHRVWSVEGAEVRPFFTGANPWLPRQKQPVGYELSGHVYAFRRENLNVTVAPTLLIGRIYPCIVPRELAVDIDTEFDFDVAELAIQRWL
jgi:CMP-N-acetylneuraminic acid synthetase